VASGGKKFPENFKDEDIHAFYRIKLRLIERKIACN
jgi:hypothetical protein